MDRATKAGRDRQGPRTLEETCLRLSQADTAALEDFARRVRVTLGTLVQGGWALVLAHEQGISDVLFGATVTGRPPELPGVESMVGAFVNTLPVRVRAGPEEEVGEWLKHVQRGQTLRQRFEHTPLHLVHEWSGLPKSRPLFESIVVFENFPTEIPVRGEGSGLEILNVESTIDEDYPRVLVVEPGRELGLHLKYDRAVTEPSAAGATLRRMAVTLRVLAESEGRSLGEVQSLVATSHDRKEKARRREIRKASLRRLKDLGR